MNCYYYYYYSLNEVLSKHFTSFIRCFLFMQVLVIQNEIKMQLTEEKKRVVLMLLYTWT